MGIWKELFSPHRQHKEVETLSPPLFFIPVLLLILFHTQLKYSSPGWNLLFRAKSLSSLESRTESRVSITFCETDLPLPLSICTPSELAAPSDHYWSRIPIYWSISVTSGWFWGEVKEAELLILPYWTSTFVYIFILPLFWFYFGVLFVWFLKDFLTWSTP